MTIIKSNIKLKIILLSYNKTTFDNWVNHIGRNKKVGQIIYFKI